MRRFQLNRPRRLIGTPAPTVPLCPERAQFDNRVHFFEQFTIVVNDNCPAAPAGKKVDNRPSAVTIQIVGRLVEKEEVRLGEYCSRQHRPRALAPGELLQERIRPSLQSEPDKGRNHPLFHCPVRSFEFFKTRFAFFGAP